MERVAILLGGIGLVAGVALLVVAHAMYAAVPFERNAEPVALTFDAMLLILYAPILIAAGTGVAAVAGSLRLMARGLSGWGRPVSVGARRVNACLAGVFAVAAVAVALWYVLGSGRY